MKSADSAGPLEASVMPHVMAMRVLSENARSIYYAARAFVDEIDRRQYDGHMTTDEAAPIYLACAHKMAVTCMREELAPYQKFAARHLAMSLKVPADDLPAELKAVMDAVVAKWRDVYFELAGEPQEVTHNVKVTGAPAHGD
jgi:hypothetical protein